MEVSQRYNFFLPIDPSVATPVEKKVLHQIEHWTRFHHLGSNTIQKSFALMIFHGFIEKAWFSDNGHSGIFKEGVIFMDLCKECDFIRKALKHFTLLEFLCKVWFLWWIIGNLEMRIFSVDPWVATLREKYGLCIELSVGHSSVDRNWKMIENYISKTDNNGNSRELKLLSVQFILQLSLHQLCTAQCSVYKTQGGWHFLFTRNSERYDFFMHSRQKFD